MNRKFRACASSYIVFGVIAAVPFVAGLAAAMRHWSALIGSGVALLGFGVVALALSRFRLVVDTESVAYASPLSPERRVSRAEIVRAGFARRTGALEGPLTFVIKSADGTELRINAKVFSREAVGVLRALEREGKPAGEPDRFASKDHGRT